MKNIIFLFLLFVLISCSENETKKVTAVNKDTEKEAINVVLNNWHKNAAEANFEAYFNAMSNESIFIGTDASENWNIEAFKSFSKPHFDKGKAWSFKSVERNVYLDASGKIAWFDELLDTWMGICRGSGVLKKTDNSWKIEHYVLSLTIPNIHIEEVKNINKKYDSIFLKKLKK